MNNWILEQLFNYQNQPKPKFAFLGTLFWMRSLAILVESKSFKDSLDKHYSDVSVKNRSDFEKSIIYENILLSLHNISSISAFLGLNKNPYDFVRAAIISWYYSIYYSSSAMITAVSGSFQETHSKTINVFQNQIIDNNLAINPFQLSLDSIVSRDVKNSINILRNGNNYDLNKLPHNEKEALGGIYSYIKGTAEYEKEKMESMIMNDNEFKIMGVNNFRTKQAREFRDSKLSRVKINFLTQSFRYRGKANYRDSLYLSYGEDNSDLLNNFIRDLELVSKSYFKMSFALIKKCIKANDIELFTTDALRNIKFNFDEQLIQS